jgi:hypothetical protein
VNSLQSLQKSLHNIIWTIKTFIGVETMNPNSVIEKKAISFVVFCGARGWVKWLSINF